MPTKIAITTALLLSVQTCFAAKTEEEINNDVDKKVQEALSKITDGSLKNNSNISTYELPIDSVAVRAKVQFRIDNPAEGPDFKPDEKNKLKNDTEFVNAWANCDFNQVKVQFYTTIAEKIKALAAANPTPIDSETLKKNDEFLKELSNKTEGCAKKIMRYQTYIADEKGSESYSNWESSH